MRIETPFNDEAMVKAIVDQLKMVTDLRGYSYHSAEEMLGVMVEEQHELLDAIHEGRGNITSSVLGELIDIAVVCIRGARSYMHGGQEVESVSDAMSEAWVEWNMGLTEMPKEPNSSFTQAFVKGVEFGRKWGGDK